MMSTSNMMKLKRGKGEKKKKEGNRALMLGIFPDFIHPCFSLTREEMEAL